MGQVFASCGHEVFGERILAGFFWKSFSREGHRATSYGVLCPECETWYRANNLILDTEKERLDWLRLDRTVKHKRIGKRGRRKEKV